MVLEGLGIDPDTARDFIFSHRPTYLTFEQWIIDQPGVDVSEENISRINDMVESRKKRPESRSRMLLENDLSEDSEIDDSIMLNNLDDWKEIHHQLSE